MSITSSGDSSTSTGSSLSKDNQSPFFSKRSIQLIPRKNPINNTDASSCFKEIIMEDIHNFHIDAVAGITMAFIGGKVWSSYIFTASALNKIRKAKTFPIADLRFLLNNNSDENLVSVRGIVQPVPDWTNFFSGSGRVLSSNDSGNTVKGVVICREFLEWVYDWIRIPLSFKFFSQVPFVVAAADDGSSKDCVGVDFNMPIYSIYKSHPLPLTSIFKVDDDVAMSTSFTGLREVSILPIGKEITAIGHIFRGTSGTPHVMIKPCKDIPYFLSDLTHDQIAGELAYKKVLLLSGGIALGSLSICVLAHTILRYWRSWKKQQNQSSN